MKKMTRRYKAHAYEIYFNTIAIYCFKHILAKYNSVFQLLSHPFFPITLKEKNVLVSKRETQ